jgi:hypothetical protein
MKKIRRLFQTCVGLCCSSPALGLQIRNHEESGIAAQSEELAAGIVVHAQWHSYKPLTAPSQTFVQRRYLLGLHIILHLTAIVFSQDETKR